MENHTDIPIAGYRLAGWLNLIATGDLGLKAARNSNTKYWSRSSLVRGQNLHSAAKLARREFGHDCQCDKH